jgi:hypothetical protein
MVTALLSMGANPQITNIAGKTPFELAGDRQTRDRFKLARHTFSEHKWNWDLAKVGKSLSEDDIRKRDEREMADAAREKARKAAETKRIADEALRRGGKSGRGVGGGNVAGDSGLSAEMRSKVERERRARAAEARFAALAKKG